MHNHTTAGKIIVISILLAVPIAFLSFYKTPPTYCTDDGICIDKLAESFTHQCTQDACVYNLDGSKKITFTETARTWTVIGTCIEEKKNELSNYYECNNEKVFEKKLWNINERDYNGKSFVIFEK